MKQLIFLLLPFALYASMFTLKDSYTFENNTIFSQEIFPNIDTNFELITIPLHLQHFSISKSRILKELLAHGYAVNTHQYGLVHFTKKTNLDMSFIQDAIALYYQKALPFLEIDSIDIRSKSFIESLPENADVVFKKQAYKYNKGTVKIVANSKRYFFDYEVHANYSQYVAKVTLRKNTPITLQNTELDVVSFTHFYDTLITFDAINYAQTKRYIKQGKPILLRDVEKLDLVKKNTTVNVKLIEGNIVLSFTATALKRGALGETIPLKRVNGTKIKGVVTGRNKVEIR